MEELLEKLLKKMEKQEKTNEENKKDFKAKKEEFKKVIDKEDETIIVVTTKATGFAGKGYEVAGLFGRLSEALIKNGISKEQLMMNVEVASLNKDEEDFKEKAFEIMEKYSTQLAERLEEENE